MNSLAKRDIECKIGSPLLVELGGIFKVRGAARCFEVTSTLDRFGIELEVIDMKEVWQLSQLYLDEHALTARHRLDMLHYAAASLIHCTHLASWNTRQFNDRVAATVSNINSKLGLLNLIAGRPEYITRRENLG